MDDRMRKPKYAAAFPKAAISQDKIMIYGDNVLVRHEGREIAMPFERFFNHLTDVDGTASGVLPNGVVHTETRGHVKFFVHQQAPRIVNINWDSRWCRDGRDVTSYGKTFSYVKATIAMPYIISVISTYDDKFFYAFTLSRSAPLNGLDSRCSPAPLLNVYEGGRICIGQGEISNEGKNNNPSANVVTNFLRALWGTSFNGDVCTSFHSWSAKVPEIALIERWEKATAVDPNFILETGYPSNFTIEGVLRRICDIAEGNVPGAARSKSTTASVRDLARYVERHGK
jgi:hypothetical protein